MFHGRGSSSLSKVFRQYDFSLKWQMTWQGPSHVGPSFPWDESFVAYETFLWTRSLILNLLTFTFLLQYLAIAPLYFSICLKASSLTQSIKSKLLLSSWWFLCSSYALTRMFVSHTSTGMTTLVSNVNLNGVSPLVLLRSSCMPIERQVALLAMHPLPP